MPIFFITPNNARAQAGVDRVEVPMESRMQYFKSVVDGMAPLDRMALKAVLNGCDDIREGEFEELEEAEG